LTSHNFIKKNLMYKHSLLGMSSLCYPQTTETRGPVQGLEYALDKVAFCAILYRTWALEITEVWVCKDMS